jgi:hypothetical protein
MSTEKDWCKFIEQEKKILAQLKSIFAEYFVNLISLPSLLDEDGYPICYRFRAWRNMNGRQIERTFSIGTLQWKVARVDIVPIIAKKILTEFFQKVGS